MRRTYFRLGPLPVTWLTSLPVKIKMGVVYEDSSSRICGGAMRSNRKSRDRKWRQTRALSGRMFCACATGSCAISTLVGPFDRKWRSHVTGSDVSHVTGSNPVRKYVLRMHNWKLRNIRPSSFIFFKVLYFETRFNSVMYILLGWSDGV
jgi:hypothetical protein